MKALYSLCPSDTPKNSENHPKTLKKRKSVEGSLLKPILKGQGTLSKESSLSMFQPWNGRGGGEVEVGVEVERRLDEIKRKRQELIGNLGVLEIEQMKYQRLQKQKRLGESESITEVNSISALMKNYKRFQREIQHKTTQYQESLEEAKRQASEQERRIKQLMKNKRLEISEENIKIIKKREELRKAEHSSSLRELANIQAHKPLFQKMSEKWRESQNLIQEQKKKETLQPRNNPYLPNHQRGPNQPLEPLKGREKKKIERRSINYNLPSPFYSRIKQENQKSREGEEDKSILPKIKRDRVQEYSKLKEETKLTANHQKPEEQRLKPLRTLSVKEVLSKGNQKMKQEYCPIEKKNPTETNTDNKENQQSKSPNCSKQFRDDKKRKNRRQKEKLYVSDLVEAMTVGMDSNSATHIQHLQQKISQIQSKCVRYKTQEQNICSSMHLKLKALERLHQLQN